MAPSGSADAGATGTRANPYATIAAGLARATADRKRLYVCDDGTGFAEPITIDQRGDGIQIFGGFDCATWAYDTGRRAVVRAPSSPALRISSLTTGALIENLEFDAPDGATPGDSSIAAIVDMSANIVLRRIKAVAGKGKDGTNGVPASGTAMSGAPGNAGHDACSANPNLGGAISITTCDNVPTSAGGKGGDGASGPPSIAAGGNGADGTPPTEAGVGKAGQGESLAGSWSCAVGAGQAGDNGLDGPPGQGGSGAGTLTSAGWIGNRGGDGQQGQPGQGGGGGGGARAPATCPSTDAGPSTPTGASAGSGGGGGCGGKGGQGGGAGGSSIAVISLQSSLTLDTCDLVASEAGKGGDGAPGQRGGAGGTAAAGGHGIGTSNDACPGGLGGRGGNGGPGGGGQGGDSLGVAYTVTMPMHTGTVITAAAGAGGAAGTGAPPTSNGASGIAAKELSL